MKKIIALMLCFVVVSLMLASCNMDVGFGSFTFRKIHICSDSIQQCITISKWHDDERGIEVYSPEYGALFFSEGTYILVGDKCPICGATNNDK